MWQDCLEFHASYVCVTFCVPPTYFSVMLVTYCIEIFARHLMILYDHYIALTSHMFVRFWGQLWETIRITFLCWNDNACIAWNSLLWGTNPHDVKKDIHIFFQNVYAFARTGCHIKFFTWTVFKKLWNFWKPCALFLRTCNCWDAACTRPLEGAILAARCDGTA